MNTAHLKSLTLENFKSWKKKSTIEFPRTGLLQIRGPCSGCGKSSIPLAIASALGICDVPANVLATWGEKTRKVSLDIEGGGAWKSMTIKRSSGMELSVDGESMRGSPKELNQRLQELLQIKDIQWLRPLTFKPQKSGAFFLELDDTEKKEFLAPICGFTQIEEALVLSVKKQEELKKRVQVAESAFSMAKGRVREVLPLPPFTPRVPIAVPDLAPFEERFKEESKRMEEARQGAVFVPPDFTEIDTEGKDLVAKSAKLLESVKEATTQLHGLEKEVSEAKNRNAKLVSSKQLLEINQKRLRSEIDHVLKKGTCYACGQELLSPDFAQKFAEKEKELASIEKELSSVGEPEDLEERLDLIKKFQALITKKQGKHAEYQSRIHELRNLRTAKLNEAHAAFESALKESLAEKNQSLSNAFRAFTEMRLEHDAAVKHNNEIEREIALRKQEEKNYEKAIADQSASMAQLKEKADDLARAKEDLEAEEWFETSIGTKGFLGRLMEEVLQEISRETNAILEIISNTQHITLAFSAVSETAKGTIKTTITPVFRAHGNEIPARSWRSVLSGGQETVVSLAIDMAVSKVLGRRTGVRMGWLILDEVLVGLSPQEIEPVLEVLRQIATEKLVLIIDHSPHAQEWFDSSIDIAYDGSESFLVNC